MKKNFFILSLFFACLSLIATTEVLAAVTIPDEVNQAIIKGIKSYAATKTNHDIWGAVAFKKFPLKSYTAADGTKWTYIWLVDLTKGEYGKSGWACGQTANVACYKQTFKMALIHMMARKEVIARYHCTYKMRTHGFIDLFGIDELTLQKCVKAG
jgi:hypothetical protein